MLCTDTTRTREIATKQRVMDFMCTNREMHLNICLNMFYSYSIPVHSIRISLDPLHEDGLLLTSILPEDYPGDVDGLLGDNDGDPQTSKIRADLFSIAIII